jgi:glyoxalase family protein
MKTVSGLHHVTAISGPAQENLDFYAGILGMRLVKKSVNQDDPGTYHLFYADAEGHPGTDLTFFPWEHLAPPRPGHGMASEVALAVPPGSLDFWGERLERYGVPVGSVAPRFGEPALAVRDPHGMHLALVEGDGVLARPFTPWEASPVPVERQVRGLHGARVRERDLGLTTGFLTATMGFSHLATEGPWHRYTVSPGGFGGAGGPGESGGSGSFLDVAEAPDEPRGAWGVGAIHHLAWRVDDEAHQLELRRRLEEVVHPTPVIDRFWFRSVYFKEPGGVLFELATEGPGFAVDEEPERLGESLVLPPWLEPRRSEIEAVLPPLAPARPEPVVL